MILPLNLIVVEGIGDIVTKPGGWGPSLQKLKIDIPELRVVFCDLSRHWHDRQTRKNRARTIRWIKRWGGEFIDKSRWLGRRKYAALLRASVDAVIIAVPDSQHINLAKYWLTGNCKKVFIEKPITNDVEEIQDWVSHLYNSEEDLARVIAFDHYRPRVHDRMSHRETLYYLLDRIGGRISKIRFYFIEDHSGSDLKYLAALRKQGVEFENRNGPIEIEGRVEALRSGIILDLLSHVFAVLEYFGEPTSIKYTQVQPAIYTGVDYDESSRALINTETFAAVKFEFYAYSENRAEGDAFVGKGVRGSVEYPEMGGNVKVLEIEGPSGDRLEINFREHVINIISGGRKQFFQYLERDPYYSILLDIAFTPEGGGITGMNVETAGAILEKLSELKSRIANEELQTYSLGTKKGEKPPMLEHLLDQIPPITF
jgi:predicted dehydrogenase